MFFNGIAKIIEKNKRNARNCDNYCIFLNNFRNYKIFYSDNFPFTLNCSTKLCKNDSHYSDYSNGICGWFTPFRFKYLSIFSGNISEFYSIFQWWNLWSEICNFHALGRILLQIYIQYWDMYEINRMYQIAIIAFVGRIFVIIKALFRKFSFHSELFNKILQSIILFIKLKFVNSFNSSISIIYRLFQEKCRSDFVQYFTNGIY